MASFREFLCSIKASACRRSETVETASMGVKRVFEAYDLGEDTFIFERGVSRTLSGRPSVLVVEKRILGASQRGRVMTVTTGNHAVAAMPLLDGRFWKLSKLPSERKSDVMTNSVICANVVRGCVEISQREVSTAAVLKCDEWLRHTLDLGLEGVVMAERNVSVLDHLRKLGQEWRVKPLAWSEAEIRAALASSKKRISTKLVYFHSAIGVHFITLPEFRRFAALAETDPQTFVEGLKELVGVYEGGAPLARQPKHRGHHEIEFFGLRRGTAIETLVPAVEALAAEIASGRAGHLSVIQRAQETCDLYFSLLARPEFGDEASVEFAETLYMHITGEVYAVAGGGATPAFDDRRTALPGATFVHGRAQLHPGADERTEVLLSNLRGMMSKDERIEYANVYEIRGEEDSLILGRGATREVVYKTDRRPVEYALVEKRLSSAAEGYAPYMLSRIGALRSLGVSLSDYYHLLKRRPGTGRGVSEYYIRSRCEGEPLDSIPADYFRSADGSAAEEREVVLGLAALMGDAAAQNMAMKKYDPASKSPLFGIGKEIYDFEYDLVSEIVAPKRVSTCSIRGSFGWPTLEYTEENLGRFTSFYLGHYAQALKDYCRKHPSVAAVDIAERFLGGFEFRTREMAWKLSVMRDAFEAFDPPLPPKYAFRKKWRFVMWALDRQERRLPSLRKSFLNLFGPLEPSTSDMV
jgi:hypothetical protein